ncbi:MAG TPA: Gldg family protein [Candidatus Hydrogenedentes bacterium]|nr:Gldg family protein [Candidatus Hydrogenedentota bacterium]HOL75994.1 Gldg family protein [Candidatus Hydrogenedentota bacterium]HPO85836.1 Gldg family protein [Candidatus Hydrogenedentota bacterium]
MNNVLTIFRRDLKAFYTSPIGYIFMIVFLLISVGLYMTTFFAFPVADMRNFFGNLPILLCVFIPAVTMRVWAEERKENTWEMLLTFPMRAWELSLGKFLATFAFFVATLAATLTVPIMLARLGNPDNGAVLGGYIGTCLLGAFFLSIGIFVSGFCKDQIVAFVVTLLVCFAIFLLGTDFVASYIDGVFPRLGTILSTAVGVVSHYTAFTRGVIEITDVLYFVVWTALFLGLNVMYIDGRNRPGARLNFSTATALCAAIGLLFNWLVAGQSFGRFDLTENKIYTVSQATRNILASLDAPVQVKVYITPKNEMPASMSKLEQDITDKLDELRVASGGKLQFSTVYLRAANVVAKAQDLGLEEKEEKKDESKVIEERMLDKGVVPFQVQTMEADQVSNKLIYSSIGVGYRDKKEEIIPQIIPDNLNELEYRLMNIVFKLTREKAPVVALVAPRDTVPPEMRQLYMQMGQPVPESMDPFSLVQKWLEHEKYDVRRVDLTKTSKLPDEYDVLVVLNPRELNDRQRYEINRALVSGKSVVMAVQQYDWDYRVTRNRLSLSQNDNRPEVNPLLEAYGLGVSKDILMDVNHVPLNISTGSLADLLGLGQPVNLPTHIVVTSSTMNQDVSITNWLATVLYLWGTAINLDKDKLASLGLNYQVLMSTTDRAWTVAGDAPSEALNTALTQEPPEKGTQYPLMVMVTGQFPDAYKDKPRPAWPPVQPRPGMPPIPDDDKEEAPATPVTPAPGKLILIGCAQAFTDNLLRSVDNKDLLLNSIDAAALGDELVNIRGKKPVNRAIERPDTGTRFFWKAVNYVGINALVAAVGVAVAILRRRSRIRYELAYAVASKQ